MTLGNDPLWTGLGLVAPLRARVGGLAGNGLPPAVGGVSIDTRTLQPGDLFFAIKGDNTDGHDYVAKAFAAGRRSGRRRRGARRCGSPAKGPL